MATSGKDAGRQCRQGKGVVVKKGNVFVMRGDIKHKGIKQYMKGDIVRAGNPLFVLIYKLNRIIRLNQKETSLIEVFHGS